jgi:hypothetical protein
MFALAALHQREDGSRKMGQHAVSALPTNEKTPPKRSSAAVVEWLRMTLSFERRHEGWLLITVLVILFGCGGRTSSADNVDGGAPDVVPGPVDSLRAAFCRAARTCCARAGVPPQPLADCESKFDPMAPASSFIANGTQIFDKSKLGPCIARMEEHSRTCTLQRTVCWEAISGTLPEGHACHDVAECKGSKDSPMVCFKPGGASDSSAKGVCRALPLAKEGELCAKTCKRTDCSNTLVTIDPNFDLRNEAVCLEEDRLYCEPGSRCKPTNADGAACTLFSCSTQSYCDSVCKPRQGHDLPCTNDFECLDEHTCKSGVCTARPFASDTLCKGGNF